MFPLYHVPFSGKAERLISGHLLSVVDFTFLSIPSGGCFFEKVFRSQRGTADYKTDCAPQIAWHNQQHAADQQQSAQRKRNRLANIADERNVNKDNADYSRQECDDDFRQRAIQNQRGIVAEREGDDKGREQQRPLQGEMTYEDD